MAIDISKLGFGNEGEIDRAVEGFDFSGLGRIARIRDPQRGYVNAPAEFLKFAAGPIASAIREQFQKRLGREPEQGEVAAVFNSINFSDPNFAKSFAIQEGQGTTRGILNIEQILENPALITDQIINTETPSANIKVIMNQLQPKFKQVDLLRDRLAGLGETPTTADVLRIVSPSTPEEDAQQLVNSIYQRSTDKRVNEQLGGFQTQQDKAITDLESILNASQGQYFSEQLAPRIKEALGARGAYHSGDLTSSLAEAGAGLQRGVRDIIAPLRTNSRLDNRQLENSLRQQLQAGQSLGSATNFVNQLLATNRQNQFSAGQAALNRQFQDEQFRQQNALSLALAGGQARGKGGVDYFLEYGLPFLGQLGGAFLGGPMGASLGGQLGSIPGQVNKKERGY